MNIIFKHKATDHKRNEFETLQSISNRGFFDNDFPELATAITSTFGKYKEDYKKKRDFDFLFASDFDLTFQKTKYKIILHAEAIGDYQLTTYSLGICKGKSCHMIRRFHFDYVHTNGGKKQKVPVSHLQYGGKGGNGVNGNAYSTQKLANWLSEPRLYYPPINLALLLDIAFCEFHTPETKKIVEDPDWRKLIMDNEKFALKHYYDTLSTNIGDARHKPNNLLRDIYYGTI